MSAASDLPPQHLEALLLHELAHIRRHDYLVNLFQSAIETLLFYHPGVWWISGVIRQERENCCDDLAAAQCGSGVTRVWPWPPAEGNCWRASGESQEFQPIASIAARPASPLLLPPLVC